MLAIAPSTLLLTAGVESGTWFWGHEGFLRPWLGLGMAWGSIEGSSRDEPLPGVDTHVWEYLRCSVGLDVVLGNHIAFGPWFRVGFGTHHDIDPTSTFLATYVFGLRVGTAFP